MIDSAYCPIHDFHYDRRQYGDHCPSCEAGVEPVRRLFRPSIEPPALEHGDFGAMCGAPLPGRRTAEWWENQARMQIIGLETAPAEPVGLAQDAAGRKAQPVARGFLDYFPDAIAEVAHVSFVANEQHNPGEPMHWAKEKSTDEADCLVRHLIQRGTIDSDGLRHTAKAAWRAMALLQREIEEERARAERR